MTLRIRVRHRTLFEYERPITETVMQLRLRPAASAGQTVHESHLTVLPEGPVSQHVDGFGNVVDHLERPAATDRLEVVASSLVECEGVPALPAPGVEPLDMLRFHGPVLDVRGIRRLAAESVPAGLSGEAALEALTEGIAGRLRYERGATSVHSDVAEVLALRAGVCQDFAHVMIACCRVLGIPARYVSGYVYEGESAEHQSHAWVEAWVAGRGWVGFDPTHPVRTGDRHIRVAVGRDYTDCAPTRGVYVGGSGSARMTVSVSLHAEPPGAPG